MALQMKLGYLDSKNPQTITDQKINDEYNKINSAVFNHLKGTDFVAVILGRCEGKFAEGQIPSKSVVVSKAEHDVFYGAPFYYRLNKMLE